jgi:hypothetical protein
MNKAKMLEQMLFDAEVLGLDVLCNTSEWDELNVDEQMQIQLNFS